MASNASLFWLAALALYLVFEMEKGYKGNSRNHFWVVNCTRGGKMAEKKAGSKYPCKVVVLKNKVKCLPTVTVLLLATISPPEQAKNKMMKEYNIIWGKWQALKMGSSSLTLCPALKKICAPGYNRFLLSLQMTFFEEQIIMEYHYHGHWPWKNQRDRRHQAVFQH